MPGKRKKTPVPTRLKVKGERTRQAILEAAVDIASVAGLEGLTIGQLATKLSLSKSGLFAHFGSKEDLQLATVDAARSIFIQAVIKPTFAAERGLSRLWKLCDTWLAYVGGKVFRGGCFFAAAAAEFDSRPGPVRDRVAAIMKEWLALLAQVVGDAQDDGQFDKTVDPVQLAFEINALELAANWAFQLYGDKQAFGRARTATLDRLHAHATASGRAVLPLLKTQRREASAQGNGRSTRIPNSKFQIPDSKPKRREQRPGTKRKVQSTKSKAQSTKREAQSTKREVQSTKREVQSTKGKHKSTKREVQSTKREVQSTKHQDQRTGY